MERFPLKSTIPKMATTYQSVYKKVKKYKFKMYTNKTNCKNIIYFLKHLIYNMSTTMNKILAGI